MSMNYFLMIGNVLTHYSIKHFCQNTKLLSVMPQGVIDLQSQKLLPGPLYNQRSETTLSQHKPQKNNLELEI